MYHSKEVQTVPNNKTTPVQDLNLNFQFVATISIPIWIQISILNSVYIENWSKNDLSTKNDHFRPNF